MEGATGDMMEGAYKRCTRPATACCSVQADHPSLAAFYWNWACKEAYVKVYV